MNPITTIPLSHWKGPAVAQDAWIADLEAGKVLYFPNLSFALREEEHVFLTPNIRNPNNRNISLNEQGQIKGALGDVAKQSQLAAMMGRFRTYAQSFIHGLVPYYQDWLHLAPTSYRPSQVDVRPQSWRADDRRLHVDAFPSRPSRGERILRVFTNIHPEGMPRVWRVGASFEEVAHHFLPRTKLYVAWQAKLLQRLHVTKSLRTEFDHIMLQLHDQMKADQHYQQVVDQVTMPFPAGSTWVCFSDQASHAVMSGQYMLEQTFHIAPEHQYDKQSSPLAILTRLMGRPLI